MPSESTPENQLAQIANSDGEAGVETTAMICSSSGTTRRSKRVESTRTNLSMNTLQTSAVQEPIHPHDNPILSVLPMFHSCNIQKHMLSGVYNGQTNVVMERFVFKDFLTSIEASMVMAAAAPPVSKVAFRQGYSMTELSCASHLGRDSLVLLVASFPTKRFSGRSSRTGGGTLDTFSDLLDATAIGSGNKEQATEVPVAFVVWKRSSTTTLTGNQIMDFVASRLANHKGLRRGVQFVDAIPKYTSGNILRKNLGSLLQHKEEQQTQNEDKHEYSEPGCRFC
ncbi:hypothetical protein BG004_008377 [Podila humilis]|nr:hypothetical protein BG004_008377 [Podila humilis]